MTNEVWVDTSGLAGKEGMLRLTCVCARMHIVLAVRVNVNVNVKEREKDDG